ncbi:MAG: hypothetical protein SNJ77_01020 [Cytophagales bacterium]
MPFFDFLLKRFSVSQLFFFAVCIRLVAVIFSKGFGFSDDHFETVALADEFLLHKTAVWPKGEIYLFSLIYPWAHAIIMGFLEFLGFDHPQTQMFWLRMFHAVLNLLMINGAGKLAKIHFGEQGQKLAVLILGFFWMMPFMGVRSLREMACMPFVVWAFYFLEKQNRDNKDLFFAGFLMAMAFVMRIQTAFIPLGVGLFMMFIKEWKSLFFLGFFTLLSLGATQVLFDFVYWGDPLGSVKAYVEYNLTHSGFYPNGPWYMYVLTVLGFCIPLFSGFLLWGFLKAKNTLPYTFWASVSFFAFHSYFPNKQERFILPFIVLFLLLGILGVWNNKEKMSAFWTKTLNISVWVFWVLNTVALLLISTTYSKKSRVEAMGHFFEKEIGSVVMCTKTELPMQPHFYHRKPKELFKTIDLSKDDKELLKELVESSPRVTHMLFTGNIGLEETIARMNKLGFDCGIEKSYEPSFVDNIAFLLNPKHNTNEVWTVCYLNQKY